MPREFVLPELAESVVEGEIVKWLVSEGERVREDQPIVEVMTDKVTVELPSPFSGVLEKRLAEEGDIVPVNGVIALFSDAAGAAAQVAGERSLVEDDGEGPADDGEALTLFRAVKDPDETPLFQVRRPDPATAAVAAAPQVAATRSTGPYGRVLAVPAARKLARELGIDIATVAGSGPNGRVRVDDVRAHAERTASGRGAGGVEREERIPLRGLRRAISNRMTASHLQAVRTLHVDEADVGALVAMRAKLKPIAEREGVRLSYLPFVMKAVVSALKAFPMINASLDEEASEIVRKHYYHLGMAVATDVGLVVPVLHDVDTKSILELADEVQRKAERARSGALRPEDVRGGTFTVTNIGSLGGLFSFPIINVPEAAILGVHSIKKRPVVLDDDRIVARHMLYLSLSFDHRVIDGAEAARFTGRVIELLETPEALLLEL